MRKNVTHQAPCDTDECKKTDEGCETIDIS